MSGDQEGTLFVPCPPNNFASTRILLSENDINRSITSLFSGYPTTDLSKLKNTMYFPSGEYSGPSSSPGAVVSRVATPPATGIVKMSKSPLRCPTNASVFPSGDHPCQYEGEFLVMRRGVPPPIGST